MKSEPNWTKEQREAFQKAWAKLIAKAWSDSTFKERLFKNPKKVLKEQGIEFPEGVECKITENTDKIVYLNLPRKPEENLSETQLREAAGGNSNDFTIGEGYAGCY